MLISCIAQGSFSQASTHILNAEGIRLKSGLQVRLKYNILTAESNSSRHVFLGHALLQNVKVTTNPSRFDLRKWAHHKFTVRRYDQYYVEFLDWTLHMGNSFESMCRFILKLINYYLLLFILFSTD